MNLRQIFLSASCILAAAVLASCASPAGNVSILQSSTVSVPVGATYAWVPVDTSTRQAADPRVANDIIQGRIQSAVDSALAAKGFRRVDATANAQLVVSYHVGLERRSETEVSTMGGGVPRTACGFRGCVSGWGLYGPPQVDVRNINYTQGTLILDLTDVSSGKLAWRATSDKRVDQNDATQAGLNAILVDMTKTLPGPTAG